MDTILTSFSRSPRRATRATPNADHTNGGYSLRHSPCGIGKEELVVEVHRNVNGGNEATDDGCLGLHYLGHRNLKALDISVHGPSIRVNEVYEVTWLLCGYGHIHSYLSGIPIESNQSVSHRRAVPDID